MKNPNKYYKWELAKPEVFVTPVRGVAYENDWLILTEAGRLTLKAGYAWNGCSPKWKVGPIVVGTWDGFREDGRQQLYYPTMVHDALHEVWRKSGKAFDIMIIHNHFNDMMKAVGFHPRTLYYWAVKTFVK